MQSRELTKDQVAAVQATADAVQPPWLDPAFRDGYVTALEAALGHGLTLDQATALIDPILQGGRAEGALNGIKIGEQNAALAILTALVAGDGL